MTIDVNYLQNVYGLCLEPGPLTIKWPRLWKIALIKKNILFYIQTYLGSFLTHLVTFKGDQKRKRYNLSQIFSVAKLLHENRGLIVLDLNVMHKI